MSECGFLVNVERCVNCYACVVACREENHLPEGTEWREVVKFGPQVIDGELSLQFVSMACMHCMDAPCEKVCPTKAISRDSNGIVLIDEKRCIGCKYCLWACPFGAPQFDPVKKVMTKCTMCVQRVEKGGVPACVETCYTQAIKWGRTEELARYMKTRAAKGVASIGVFML